MKRFFFKFAVLEHIYTISLSFVLIILSLFLAQSPLMQFIRILAFIGLVAEITILSTKYYGITRFVKDHPVTGKVIRTIENAVFTENEVMAYIVGRYGRLYSFPYESIDLARHNYNVYEQVRPGYRGHHKVVLQAGEAQIPISVENAEIAETILNFIQTKNPTVTFYHKTSQFHPVQLEELDNWEVKGRF